MIFRVEFDIEPQLYNIVQLRKIIKKCLKKKQINYFGFRIIELTHKENWNKK